MGYACGRSGTDDLSGQVFGQVFGRVVGRVSDQVSGRAFCTR
jgi:hypothetical protein